MGSDLDTRGELLSKIDKLDERLIYNKLMPEAEMSNSAKAVGE